MLDPTKSADLQQFGDTFWLEQLQPLRAGYALPEGDQIRLSLLTFDNVDQLVVVTNLDCGCSINTTPILTMKTAGQLTALLALHAVWASYMLSLKATVDAGKNRRAHIGRDADAIDLANKVVELLGATVTPCDEVYGSGGTFLEKLHCWYNSETRTLTVNPYIGS